jgi:hypothetical protein
MQATTQLIHSIPVDPLTGAISVPIYQTSTFVQEAPGVNKGYDYARTGNPTRATLESLVAQLEGGQTGAAFASGLAAIDAVVKLLQSGDEIVAVDDIYGGAFRLFEQVYKKFGITVHYTDTSDIDAVSKVLTAKDETDLDRDAYQSHAEDLRYPGPCGPCEGAWLSALRRQYVCITGVAEAAGAGRRPGRPFRHEVPGGA